MARWRPFEDYSPFARILVQYMWEQRPPLLPNQFAHRMGVRKQQVSTWLNTDATPAPSVLVRLARGMGRPVSELFIAAEYATADDPLFDVEDAWTHILARIQEAPEFLTLAEPQQILVVGVLHAAHMRERNERSASGAENAGDAADALDQHAEDGANGGDEPSERIVNVP